MDSRAFTTVPRCPRRLLVMLSLLVLVGCAPKPLDDPLNTLRSPEQPAARYLRAMTMLDEDPDSTDYRTALKRIVVEPGYTVKTREAAFARLEERDVAGLKELLILNLARIEAWQWRTRLCEHIADRDWTALTPSLVRSWATPTAYVAREKERPEYKALAQMYGADRVYEVVFDLFKTANDVYQHNLRIRCWELLHRLGFREELAELVRTTDPDAGDALMTDLHTAAVDLGILPWNRQEILWLRVLRQPKYQAFWNEATSASRQLTAVDHDQIELRDLPIIVSAARHNPELLRTPRDELYERLRVRLQSGDRNMTSRSYDGLGGDWSQTLVDHRKKLTWGDLAAIEIALQAMNVPAVSRHLFDFAERDRRDRSTEYGGIITLDAKGRFEILEYHPTSRMGDFKFITSMEMLERGYTALFHFHYHAQKYDNARYAGPGSGDVNYADAQRTNCLVFTFTSRSTLGVDFYRHGRVIVDLGEIQRP